MKHLEVRQECSAAYHILNSFLDASYRDETLCFVLDKSLDIQLFCRADMSSFFDRVLLDI